MAVTQQLARVSPETLAGCQKDPTVLQGLLSFSLDRARYLDLDHAPAGLGLLAHLSRQSYDAQSAIRFGCNGLRAVNPALPPGEVEDGPDELTPQEVLRVTAGLATVDVEALVEVLTGPNLDRARVHALIVDPERGHAHSISYYRHHFEALRDFYKEAAAAGEAVVVWWD